MSTADNFNDIYYSLKYEADLLFTRFLMTVFFSNGACNRHTVHIEKLPASYIRVTHCILNVFVIHFKNRDSNPTRYEIKSELSLEEPGVIGPPFNFTFQVSLTALSTLHYRAWEPCVQTDNLPYSMSSLRSRILATFPWKIYSWILRSQKWPKMATSSCRYLICTLTRWMHRTSNCLKLEFEIMLG